MAKPIEPCMFCSPEPCSCRKTKLPKATKKVAPQLSADLPVERDLALESALRSIRHIVCHEDQVTIDSILERELPHDIDQQLAVWRRRNGKA